MTSPNAAERCNERYDGGSFCDLPFPCANHPGGRKRVAHVAPAPPAVAGVLDRLDAVLAEMTPGPWAIVKQTNEAAYSIHQADSDVRIAEVAGLGPHGPANAVLIGAAPDMLDAAKAALDFMPSSGQPEIVALRAAIKVAEGAVA